MRCKLWNGLLWMLLLIVSGSSFAAGSKHNICPKLVTRAVSIEANAKHAVSLESYLKLQGEYNQTESLYTQHKCQGNLPGFPEFKGAQHKNASPKHSVIK